MRYFDTYLTAGKSVEDLDISVQCDIKIFEWLVNYLNDVVGEGKSKLDPQNAVSVLISSDYLGIEELVEKCLIFVSKHL